MKSISLLLLSIFSVLLIACSGNTAKNTQEENANLTADTTSGIEVNPLKNCYFGDLHLHTALSPDANLFGAVLLPEDSYRFARGEEVDYLGHKVKRVAPLDFLAVTDHSEYLGVIYELRKPNGMWAGTELQKQWSSSKEEDIAKGFGTFITSIKTNTPIPELDNKEAVTNGWKMLQDAAAKYNQPGKFTTFIGYEWTSQPVESRGGSQNLHRCIIFKGDKVPAMPYSSFDSDDPENLWTYLENARKEGSDVIAVPHNANLSNGLMFDTKTLSGKPLTKEYAERRMNNEPLTEMNQGKGTSETTPKLSPNDEFANYELMGTLLNSNIEGKSSSGSYIRQAYGTGQELQEKLGANPFKYGLEGGTDYHSGISTSEENAYPGSHNSIDDVVNHAEKILAQTTSIGGEAPTKIAAAGITGVWAESNTRDAIFDALKRKECFATSGVRLQVRMFAGWNYSAEMTKANDWVKQAYAGGVPMGADLPAGSGKPKFLVQAVKDPNSGNLDRIQIIKVTTLNGKSTEKIYDVVWSGDRKPDAKGKLPAVGSTVDVKGGKYENTIGAAELTGYWEDPDFNPDAYVTYYARVLEIPTPRWTTLLAAQHQLPASKIVPETIQERAWTSPVWYTPSK